MTSTGSIGAAVAIIGLAGTAAVLSNRVSIRTRIPAPAIFLLSAAAVTTLVPQLAKVSLTTVQNVVTVALVMILFDGGMHMGWRRFRSAVAATGWLGVVGTLVTAGAMAAAAHFLFSFGWRLAILLGTALSPTDPATVFSVLGRREVGGRSGVMLEGESGANDPVGIALLLPLLTATGSLLGATEQVATTFVVEMVVGVVIGIAGGRALLIFMRKVPLPNDSLYSLRVFASVLAIYGLASLAHGSGFLAVFIAGILIGDERAPYKREIGRFHSSIASLAEVVAFSLLGLTVNLRNLPAGGAWYTGIVLAALLAFVIRPVFVGLIMLPVRLKRGERAFVLWTGLRGAVPILLGSYIASSGISGAEHTYEVIFVVVAFSVIIQGGLVPTIARRAGVPLRVIEPEPWSLGVRFRQEPERLHRFCVARGSPAVGTPVGDVPGGEDTWVSFILRSGRLVAARPVTQMEAGDEILVLADPADATELHTFFTSTPDGGRPPGERPPRRRRRRRRHPKE